MSVKYYSPTTGICIIRVARDHHKIAWGAVTLMSTIEGIRVVPHVLHVSGTIKHAQLAAIAHNREAVARYRAQAKTPGECFHCSLVDVLLRPWSMDAAAYQDSYDAYLEKSTLEIEGLQD
ncbi:hypothetical protein H0H81_004384 [Sphagnurus paluster]|uniref:Uncharacterized protein n=1 Tax=Sphagnurus paluster TaxID=117069 RepID=A0A9P7GTD7_9AGAR|nr:hypothetical protein H0H81_004384 [Sphagnurus paluster]